MSNTPTIRSAKRSARRSKILRIEDMGIRRLSSARVVNECVEQFHVFSLECEDRDDLLDAFARYLDEILSVLKIRRVDSGEVLEADILLINADWQLVQSCATHQSYWRYVPEMNLVPVPGATDGSIEQPKLGDGLASFAIWASKVSKPGVVIARDVRDPNTTAQFWEEVRNKADDGITYRPSEIGAMYKPPRDGQPPYTSILSASIPRTISAFGDPIRQPRIECLGVLNITHSNSVTFTAEDCAWAQICASLCGSLHASLYTKYLANCEKWDPTLAKQHPNEIALKVSSHGQPRSRVKGVPSTPAAGHVRSTSDNPSPRIFSDEQHLRHERIEPWLTLDQSRYLIEVEHIREPELRRMKEHLTRLGICLFRIAAQRSEEEIVQAIADALGPMMPEQNQSVGPIKSIKPVHEKAANTGDSAKALGPHVDGTQQPATPPILMFQYVAGADFGARSQFWDAAHSFLQFEDEQRHQILSAFADPGFAKFEKNGHTYSGPLVRMETPTSASFRFRMDDVFDVVNPLHQPHVDAVRGKFQQRGLEFTPRRGDIVVFDNWRLLHGRTAVGGSSQREHRRVWIQEVHPEMKTEVHLGVRPLDAKTIAAIHGLQRTR